MVFFLNSFCILCIPDNWASKSVWVCFGFLRQCEFRHPWVHLISFVGCWIENSSSSFCSMKIVFTNGWMFWLCHVKMPQLGHTWFISLKRLWFFFSTLFPLQRSAVRFSSSAISCCPAAPSIEFKELQSQNISDDFAQTHGRTPRNLLQSCFIKEWDQWIQMNVVMYLVLTKMWHFTAFPPLFGATL